MLNNIKEFFVELVKTSWFKIIAFIFICYVLYLIMDLANIHKEMVYDLDAKLATSEITYEQADYIRSATHEQIVYQLAMPIIVSMVFVVAMIMEQNSKLRERVRRIDFRLWKMDRNIEEIYELQRLSYEKQYDGYETNSDYESDGSEDDEALKKELERLEEERRKLIEEVRQLEEKYKARLANQDEE